MRSIAPGGAAAGAAAALLGARLLSVNGEEVDGHAAPRVQSAFRSA